MTVCRILIALFPALVTGCYYLIPFPDHHLTKKEWAWGKVRREAPYVLLCDYRPTPPNPSSLRNSSCPEFDDVGVLAKGTVIKFTGFCVKRSYWGAMPLVYGEVMDGEYAGKTFTARGLVDARKDSRKRTARMVDIRRDRVRPAP